MSQAAAQKKADQPRPKNWLLIKIRNWHTWMGVALAIFIVMVCITGIILNHKDFFIAKEEKTDPKTGMVKKEDDHAVSGLLRSNTQLASLNITPDRALSVAMDKLGDTPLEKIELKDEHGELVYKVKAGDGREVVVSVASGDVTTKGGYKEYKEKGAAAAMTGGEQKAGYDWGKIIKDLHTGKIGGEAGKLFIDLTSFVIIVLTVSGVWLWAVPKYRKAKAQREAAAKIAAAKPKTDLPAAAPALARQA